jgi:hypothetical protein
MLDHAEYLIMLTTHRKVNLPYLLTESYAREYAKAERLKYIRERSYVNGHK